jgi:hypothetical protein
VLVIGIHLNLRHQFLKGQNVVVGGGGGRETMVAADDDKARCSPGNDVDGRDTETTVPAADGIDRCLQVWNLY